MIVIVLAAALSAWALTDVLRTPGERITPPGHGLWALLVLVPLIGPLAWLVGGHRPSPLPSRVPIRPLAPDDDPEFLRLLQPPDDD
jgi:Phospholipase_D-nuclease N-terminal